ncbi:Alpha/Beta hydrolase protein [Aspergillus granulosus]|uniref:Alpha/Beta hydrolase protein n=1 Tax=Aspergillus granulosus TaxID=176169 RepID=A0ABR4H652_9EURO
MADTTPLRAIIVGASPVGLFLGYALGLANIDSIQLLEPVQRAATAMQKKRTDRLTGNVLTTAQFPEFTEQKHGHLPIDCSELLLRILYDNIPDKENRVHLKNGAVENGSIVIGADGVHSKARSELQVLYKAANGFDANAKPMMVNFNGVIGRASNEELRIEEAMLLESRGTGTDIVKTGSTFATITPNLEVLAINDPRVDYKQRQVEDGITYHYIAASPDFTPSTTALLLHGWPDLTIGWRYQIPFLLLQGIRVIVPDFFGYVKTSAPRDIVAYSFKHMSAHFVKPIQAETDLPVILGGHDWDSYLAWRLALYSPELVKGVFSLTVPYFPRTLVVVTLEEFVQVTHPSGTRYS